VRRFFFAFDLDSSHSGALLWILAPLCHRLLLAQLAGSACLFIQVLVMSDETVQVIRLPEGSRGFYICRENDYWLLGRPCGHAISWERVELIDLFNLGVDCTEIENIVVGRTYSCAVPLVVPQLWD
jgi:hypothetical protein